jgi:hypothetical protein
MRVAFDASTFLLTLDPDARAPMDPSTGQPVERAAARAKHLLATLEKNRAKIIIPSPTLSEVMMKLTPAAAMEYLDMLNSNARFEIAPFDERGAIELVELTREVSGPNKKGGINAPWAKIKFDRQIMAIARVHQVAQVYSDDGHLHALGQKIGLEVVRTADLPLPPEDPQGKLNLESPDKDKR